jgi:hypothetical protein
VADRTIQKAWKYLASLWGSLSAVSILFPGAAGLVKAKIAPEHSGLTVYYGLLPSIFAAFALLLLTTFRRDFGEIRTARRVAISAFVGAILLMFGFLYTRQQLVDINEIRPPQWNGTRVTTFKRSSGHILIETVDTATHTTISALEGGDPRDILQLALLTGLFGAFTIAFGSLGLYEYQRKT